MKDGGDEGIGEVAFGWLRSDACVGVSNKETGDRTENAVCKMSDRCSEIGGMSSQGWLLPGSFADAPGNEKTDECSGDTWSGFVVC